MQSFQFTSQIDQKGILNLQLPPSLANKEVDIVIVIHPKSQQMQIDRPIGQYVGKMRMSDDFSAPFCQFFIPENVFSVIRGALKHTGNNLPTP